MEPFKPESNPEFKPAYPGDNPNRAWVRNAMEKKGIKVDYRDVIMHMSNAHIRWEFKQIIQQIPREEWDLYTQRAVPEEEWGEDK